METGIAVDGTVANEVGKVLANIFHSSLDVQLVESPFQLIKINVSVHQSATYTFESGCCYSDRVCVAYEKTANLGKIFY